MSNIIGSLEDFQKFINNFPADEKWIFRGQPKAGLMLIPRAGRLKYSIDANQEWREKNQMAGDLGRFEEWRKKAKDVFHELPDNDFDCLAFAQHYGLVTRLLDWTKNPRVALFFAVRDTKDHKTFDGEVIAYKPKWRIEQMAARLTDQHLGWDICVIEPKELNPRVIAQKGLFTFHVNPWANMRNALKTDEFKPVVVACDKKNHIRDQLREAGIYEDSMFPDIKIISKAVNEETERMAKIERLKEEARFGYLQNPEE